MKRFSVSRDIAVPVEELMKTHRSDMKTAVNAYIDQRVEILKPQMVDEICDRFEQTAPISMFDSREIIRNYYDIHLTHTVVAGCVVFTNDEFHDLVEILRKIKKELSEDKKNLVDEATGVLGALPLPV